MVEVRCQLCFCFSEKVFFSLSTPINYLIGLTINYKGTHASGEQTQLYGKIVFCSNSKNSYISRKLET